MTTNQKTPGALKYVLFLCIFMAGLTSLLYELVWSRLLLLSLGSSAIATTIVISTFLGGLALGSFFFGRVSVQSKNPLLLFGILELLLGIYALLLPFILKAVPSALTILTINEHTPFLIQLFVKIVLSVVALILPSLFIGGALPLLTRFMVRSKDTLGKEGGILYATSTIGAVCGTFLTGFLLLPRLGVQNTTLIGAVLNLLVFAILLAVTIVLKENARPAGEESGVPRTASGGEGAEGGEKNKRNAIYLLVLLAGFTSLAYEVTWNRTLTLILGSTLSSLTILLAAFLTGIGVGSLVLSWFMPRVKRPLVGFGIVQVVLAFTVFLGICVLPSVPFWTFKLLSARLKAGQILSVQFIISFGILILPTLAMGMAFPLALKAVAPRVRRAGQAFGAIYGWNTIGAIAGAIIAGFFLIPILAPKITLLVLVFLNFVIGTAAFFLAENRFLHRGIFAIIVIVLILFVPASVPEWDPSVLSSPTYENLESILDPDIVFLSSTSEYEGILRRGRGRRTFYREGLSSMVTVHQAGGRYILSTDGLKEASLPVPGKQRSLSHIDLLMGLLPSFLSPTLDDALVCGLGGATTVQTLQIFPYKTIDVVEIEPAIEEAVAHIYKGHKNPLHDSRVNLFLNDARNFLLCTEKQYNTVISHPSQPWLSRAAPLFTKEFLEIGKGKLKEDGVFCQWLNLFSNDVECVQSFVNTFSEVFPHYLAFKSLGRDRTDFSLILVGFKKKPRLELQQMSARFQSPTILSFCNTHGFRNLYSLLSLFVWGEKQGNQYAADGVIITDDNPYLETTMQDKIYYTYENYPNVLKSIDSYRESLDAYFDLVSSGALSFKLKLIEALEDRLDWDGVFTLFKTLPQNVDEIQTPEEKAMFLSAKAKLENRLDNSEEALRLLEKGQALASAPLLVELGRVQRRMADDKKPGATGESSKYFEQALEKDPSYSPAIFERAWNYILEGYPLKGKKALLEEGKKTSSPYYPEILLLLADYFFKKEKNYDQALHFCELYHQVTPDRPEGLYLMGNLLAYQSRVEEGAPYLFRAKNLNQVDMAIHFAKADLAQTKNQNDVGIAHLMEVLDACDLHISYFDRAVRNLKQKNMVKEFKKLNEAYSKNLLNPRETYKTLSEIFEKQGKIVQAIKYVKFYIERAELEVKDPGSIYLAKKRLKELENAQ